MKIIYTVQIVIHCAVCGTQMVYHACYTVTYKSNVMKMEIVILRYKCKKCNVTHAIKPEFLASRHQYDTFERQAYVLAYTFPNGKESTLRKLQTKLFPFVDVSHTVMYYWVRVVEVKNLKVEPLLLADLQAMLPHEDISGDLTNKANVVPPNTRNKIYSHKTVKLFQWADIYISTLNSRMNLFDIEIMISPYLYLNRILDMLMSHAFF